MSYGVHEVYSPKPGVSLYISNVEALNPIHPTQNTIYSKIYIRPILPCSLSIRLEISMTGEIFIGPPNTYHTPEEDDRHAEE
jgi:hypothetical protein